VFLHSLPSFSHFHTSITCSAVALSERGIQSRDDPRGLCRETITRYIEAEVFPEITPPPKKASILDPYKPYILQRWQQRCCNGVQLYEEIKARGYTGSQPLLAIFLADLRKKHQEAGDPNVLTLDDAQTAVLLPSPLPAKPKVAHRMSPTRASWLFISKPAKLDEKQQRLVEQIRESHPDLDVAYAVCCVYAEQDEALREELEKHLALLQRQGVLGVWQQSEAGARWQEERAQALFTV
jgi:hypothetical protein